jgi:hypothetical protein
MDLQLQMVFVASVTATCVGNAEQVMSTLGVGIKDTDEHFRYDMT